MRVSYSLILFVILGFVSCRKDRKSFAEENNKDCYSFPNNLPAVTYYVPEVYMYKQPCFNPNNQNEFVFCFRNYSQKITQLIKYNLITKQKTILLETNSYHISGHLKWSRKGWIAYTRANPYVDHVFIIKENGDSLRQMSTFPANFYPIWDSKGDNLYWVHSRFLSEPAIFLKRPLYGNNIDTLLRQSDPEGDMSYRSDVAYNNNLMFASAHIGYKPCLALANLSYSPLKLSKILSIEPNSPILQLQSLAISHDGNEAYLSCYNSGLYRLNINTGQLTLLIPYCQSKHYDIISCSPDGKYLIGERVDRRLKLDANGQPTREIIEKSTIHLINLNTLEESKIEID